MGIGDRIKELRLGRSITRKKFAEIIGVSRSIIYAWETNIKQPSLFNAMCIAQFFGVTIDYIATGES